MRCAIVVLNQCYVMLRLLPRNYGTLIPRAGKLDKRWLVGYGGRLGCRNAAARYNLPGGSNSATAAAAAAAAVS